MKDDKEDLHRWCKNCEAYTLSEKSNPKDGNRFFGCSNFPSCRQTEKVFVKVDIDPPRREASEEELREEQRKLKVAQLEGAKQLEALALKYGVLGPKAIELKMRAEIPGFGKKYEDLSDEDKDLRAKFFSNACAMVGIGQQLPYDKDERDPGRRRTGRENPDDVE